jgi:cell division protein FtsW
LATGGLLPGFQLQPSEFAKLGTIIFLAGWLAAKGRRAGRFSTGSLPFLAVVGLVAGLIMREPDMGTAIVVMLAAATVFWVAGANVIHVGTVVGLAGVAMVWLINSAAYRAERLQGWVDPWADPLGAGWHTTQNMTAIGSGGMAGRGLGASIGKAYFVPNAHTDAIFAILGEELGLIGTVLVLLLFGVIAWRGLVLALRASDSFGQLLAVGATGLIVWQALLNMMVVTNAVPFTGVTLPFLSFGGSSLVASLAAVGLLLSVSRGAPATAPQDRPARAERRAEYSRDGAPRRRPIAARPSRPSAGFAPRASLRQRPR